MKRALFAVLLFAASCCTAAIAPAQTITVNTGLDPIDIDPATATVADLPGPDGKVSISEAMIVSNNMPGRQTIAFAIPQAEWQWQGLYPGIAVIWTQYSFYLTAYDPVIIDGTTQTAFTGDTNPAGAEVYLFGGQLYFGADDCVVRGTTHMQLRFEGSRELIEDNSEVGVTLYRGSGSVIRRNNGGVTTIDQANNNFVVGNTFGRVRVLGWTAGGFPARGNRIGGPAPADRNNILGYGTWSTHGTPGGFAVQIFDTDSTLLENNSIGTLPDGLTPAHAATTLGVSIEDQNSNVLVRNNRIAGILAYSRPFIGSPQPFGTAIGISGAGDGIEITGNTIGLNANGEAVLGSVTGIDVGSFFSPGLQHVRIGRDGAGQGNAIAGHLFNGVLVGREVQDTRISGNAIYRNHGIGIDLVTTLSAYGVTANDPLDPDTGGNALQNFPQLQSAASSGVAVHAVGSLQSEAATPYRLEFFASPACDSLGHGEGQVFIGFASVTTNAAGNAPFDLTMVAPVTPGWVLTSTATNANTGATSEFSACRLVGTEAIAGTEPTGAIAALRLAPATPNPFRAATSVRYTLPRGALVSLAVHDLAGRMVRQLQSGWQPAGAHDAEWNGLDAEGHSVPAGLYLVQLRAGSESATGRLILTR